MADSPSQRLRPHPEQRFATSEEQLNLEEVSEYLRKEPSGRHGHKQMALFKHGPATLALFHFERGAKLDDHTVDGPVIIHVLDGRLRVRCSDSEHDLAAGTLLRLSPGVRHNVRAEEDSRMLLTVCLEGPGSHG